MLVTKPGGIREEADDDNFTKVGGMKNYKWEEPDQILIIGDLITDHCRKNHPLARPKIQALQPTLDTKIMKNVLKRINQSPTRHLSHHK